MGYNTHFELIEGGDAIRTAVCERIDFDPFEDSCKWYNYETDLIAVSKLHPSTVIVVTGDGEEQGDCWARHILNGDVEEYRQPDWEPPPVSKAMRAQAKHNAGEMADAERTAAEAAERGELARLKAKYEGGE